MEHSLQDHAVKIIKETLLKKGLTQKQLADDILMSRQQLSKYLTKRTELTLTMFEQICAALNILPAEVFINYPDGPNLEDVVKTIQPVNYKKKIIELQKRVNELENDKKHLSRALDLIEDQFQRKANEVDKLEMELSEFQHPNKQTG